MVLLMFRNGRIEAVPSCSDVVHKEGALVCLDARGAVIDSFGDKELLYYTLNPRSIQTIQALKEGAASSSRLYKKRQPPASILERLWRMRKMRQVRLRQFGRIKQD